MMDLFWYLVIAVLAVVVGIVIFYITRNNELDNEEIRGLLTGEQIYT